MFCIDDNWQHYPDDVANQVVCFLFHASTDTDCSSGGGVCCPVNRRSLVQIPGSLGCMSNDLFVR